MTFTLQQPNGMEVLRSTVSASGSSPYVQRCRLCKPDPSEAFTEAFSGVFAQLSKTLGDSELHLSKGRLER